MVNFWYNIESNSLKNQDKYLCSGFVDFDADFGCGVPDDVTDVGVGSHENVAAVVKELDERFVIYIAAELLHRRGQNDEGFENVHSVFDQVQTRIVRGLKWFWAS